MNDDLRALAEKYVRDTEALWKRINEQTQTIAKLTEKLDTLREWQNNAAKSLFQADEHAATLYRRLERYEAVIEAARAPTPGCDDCGTNDDIDGDEPLVMCAKHEKMLGPLRIDTLRNMVIDLWASCELVGAAVAALDSTDAARSALQGEKR